MRIAVIGAGLAGTEAALAAAKGGLAVDLYECKPAVRSPAHRSDGFAELVCSNSLKAERIESAAGLLKWEMEQLGSATVAAAKQCRVPAGGALAVDRDRFSELLTGQVKNCPGIRIIPELVEAIPTGYDAVVIATGPLTCGALPEAIRAKCGAEYLSFFDAAAPIVTADSLDRGKVFSASRYGRGEEEEGDYLNCPFNKEEYEAFYDALIHAERAPQHEFEEITVYEGCMPIEILASRGPDAARFGPMKPVGLTDPRTGHRPWAAVQLRRENAGGTMYNLVGFQTNLKFGEQQRVFSMIPGLADAEFVRYGVMHRNTFLDAPRLLNADFSLRSDPALYFAGQISGVEGYMESAMAGLVVGTNLARKAAGRPPMAFPPFTMIGALTGYISDQSVTRFQPMGANFGILPPLDKPVRDKKQRYAALAARAAAWYEETERDRA